MTSPGVDSASACFRRLATEGALVVDAPGVHATALDDGDGVHAAARDLEHGEGPTGMVLKELAATESRRRRRRGRAGRRRPCQTQTPTALRRRAGGDHATDEARGEDATSADIVCRRSLTGGERERQGRFAVTSRGPEGARIGAKRSRAREDRFSSAPGAIATERAKGGEREGPRRGRTRSDLECFTYDATSASRIREGSSLIFRSMSARNSLFRCWRCAWYSRRDRRRGRRARAPDAPPASSSLPRLPMLARSRRSEACERASFARPVRPTR